MLSRFCTLLVACLFALAWKAAISSAEEPAPLAIGSRRELFVDRYSIDKLEGAWLQMHAPRDEGPVLRFDEAWEGPQSGYCTILADDFGNDSGNGIKFRLYYRGIPESGPDRSEHERTCVAASADGLPWTKPKLGLFTFAGNSDNNLLLDIPSPLTHKFCHLIDTRPGVSPKERYKAVGGTLDKLFAYVSSDGLKWRRLQEAPVLTKENVPIRHDHLFDSQNLAFWSETESRYVCYFRVWDGVRRIARSTSDDFVHWSPAVLMKQYRDDGVAGGERQSAPEEHLYTNQTSPYFRAPHIYLAIAARFFPDRQVVTEEQARQLNVDPGYFRDTSDAVLMTSRGGDVYDRAFLEGFVRPGIGLQNWVSRTNYPALNVVQTSESELSLYVNQDYAQPTAHVRRYSLRLDGFASLRAGAAPGELITKPLVFEGNSLSINFSTSAAGGMRFELQDADGKQLPGFALADCQEQIGNEFDRRVTWTSGADLGSLAGKPVRLRVELKDGDLFSFKFGD